MDLKELVNLYLDICEGLLLKITFDKSSSDNANQFLFFLSLEQSLNFLADDILSSTSMDSASFSSLNTLAKWDFLSNEPAIKNIIIKEQLSEGFLNDLFETQKNYLIL